MSRNAPRGRQGHALPSARFSHTLTRVLYHKDLLRNCDNDPTNDIRGRCDLRQAYDTADAEGDTGLYRVWPGEKEALRDEHTRQVGAVERAWREQD